MDIVSIFTEYQQSNVGVRRRNAMMINEISTCPQKNQHHTSKKYSAGSTYTIVFDESCVNVNIRMHESSDFKM